MKEYSGRISYLLPILFLPGIFTLLATLGGELLSSSGFFMSFWLLSLIIVSIPLGYKLKIQNDLVSESFCGMKIKSFQTRNVESVTYGGICLFELANPIFGIPHGKGIVLLVNINGTRKTYSFSEKLYGKQSVEYITSMLNSQFEDMES